MALLQCAFHSGVLGLQTDLTAIIPQNTSSKDIPVLYLLHGLSDNHMVWIRRTSIERYVETLGLAVIMPQVHRSFYTDMNQGGKYWTFLSEELPSIAESLFPVSTNPKKRYVAGLSMGGYGAMKWALRQPERFAAAASLSGAMDVNNGQINRQWPEDYQRIFGTAAGEDDDLLALLRKQAGRDDLPMLYQCCGTEDFLYEDNLTFKAQCEALRIPLTYEEEPGDHSWAYWDMKIQRVLKWLPLT